MMKTIKKSIQNKIKGLMQNNHKNFNKEPIISSARA